MSKQGFHMRKKPVLSEPDMLCVHMMHIDGASAEAIARHMGYHVGVVRRMIHGDNIGSDSARKTAECIIMARIDQAQREHSWYAEYKRAT